MDVKHFLIDLILNEKIPDLYFYQDLSEPIFVDKRQAKIAFLKSYQQVSRILTLQPELKEKIVLFTPTSKSIQSCLFFAFLSHGLKILIVSEKNVSSLPSEIQKNNLLWSEQLFNLQKDEELHSEMTSIENKEDEAQVGFLSSGTTGQPKMIWHHFLQVKNKLRVYENALPRTEIALSTSPLSHVYGFIFIYLQTIWRGQILHYYEKYQPLLMAMTITKHHVSTFYGTPRILKNIIEHTNPNMNSFADLKLIYTAGGPLPEETVEKIQTKLKCTLVDLYGLTEYIGSVLYAIKIQGSSPLNFPNRSRTFFNGINFRIKKSENRLLLKSKFFTAQNLPVDEDGYYDTGDNIKIIYQEDKFLFQFLERNANTYKRSEVQISVSLIKELWAKKINDPSVVVECTVFQNHELGYGVSLLIEDFQKKLSHEILECYISDLEQKPDLVIVLQNPDLLINKNMAAQFRSLLDEKKDTHFWTTEIIFVSSSSG